MENPDMGSARKSRRCPQPPNLNSIRGRGGDLNLLKLSEPWMVPTFTEELEDYSGIISLGPHVKNEKCGDKGSTGSQGLFPTLPLLQE